MRLLQLGKGIDFLASTGLKKVRMWDTRSWEQAWESNIVHMCMTILFMEEQQLLLGALKNNHLMV